MDSRSMGGGQYGARMILRSVFALLVVLLIACGERGPSDLRLGEERAANSEAATTAEMIEAIKAVSLKRYPEAVIKRFNQAKNLGCFDAAFSVRADLPTDLQRGLFVAGKTYPAKIRFANASKFDDTQKDFRGFSIKLFGVAGATLWGDEGEQDFLLNSHPALFAANPDDFLDFIEAAHDDKVWRYFINPSHFYSLMVVLKGRARIENPFAIRYWSTTPYRFGSDISTAVKYSVQSCSAESPTITVDKHENFLTEVMQQHLKQSAACFDFMVQFQQDPADMPIEDAAVVWDENRSSFMQVATITIEDQSFTSEDASLACEAMSFNPWQSLAAHRPLGGINRVRKPVYAEIAEFRKQENMKRMSVPQ